MTTIQGQRYQATQIETATSMH